MAEVVGGNWNFVAPLQGAVQGSRVVAARGTETASRGSVSRPAVGRDATSARAQSLANRVPDTGVEARAQQIAALERDYYARSLAQSRVQNWRGARISRGGGGRR